MNLHTIETKVPLRLASVAYRAAGIDPYTDWNRQHHAIFVHVPKTAGRSISRALTGEDSSDHVPLRRYHAVDPHAAVDYFSFAVVRNPWDRFVSAFNSLKGSAPQNPGTAPGARYKAFVEEVIDPSNDVEAFASALLRDRRRRRRVFEWYHFRPQVEWLSVGRRAAPVDLVGRFELLDEAWREISHRLHIEVELPVIGVSRHSAHDSDSVVELVSHECALDIERFGYEAR